MKVVKIPKYLQELLGEEISRLELLLTLFSSIAVSGLLLFLTFDEWGTLTLWRQILLVLLTVDITGGVVANFSASTNDYYKTRPKARLKFILFHIQPLLLAFLLGSNYAVSMAVLIYTLVAALLVNYLYTNVKQKVIAATLVFVGITALLLLAKAPVVLMALFAMHIFKVVFGFAVDHYQISV